jgi:hypothetical protein
MIDSEYEIKTPNFEFQRAGYLHKLAADPMVVSDLSENFIEERSLNLYYHQLGIRGRLQPSATGQSISIASKAFLAFQAIGTKTLRIRVDPGATATSFPHVIFTIADITLWRR